jgi:hypothetical protein
MTRSDLIDLDVHVYARTEKAVLVSADGVKENAVWVPLSQIEIEPHESLQRIYVMTLPEWLATEKGLV